MHLSQRALELLVMMFGEQSGVQVPMSHLAPALEIRDKVRQELEQRKVEPN